MTELDHVIWAVPSLDQAIAALLRSHGLAAVSGGSHPAWGTRNAIVPLGGAYLELVEVADPDAPMVGFTQAVARAAADGGRLCLWCVRTGDIDGEAAPRGLHVTPGEREGPDGSVITWQVAGMAEACADPAVPFIIQWDDDGTMPGSLAVDHPAGEARIVNLDVQPDGPRSLRIACSQGEFTLP